MRKKTKINLAAYSTLGVIMLSQLSQDDFTVAKDALEFKNFYNIEDFKDQFDNDAELLQFVETLNYNEYVKHQQKENKEYLSFTQFLEVAERVKVEKEVKKLMEQPSLRLKARPVKQQQKVGG